MQHTPRAFFSITLILTALMLSACVTAPGLEDNKSGGLTFLHLNDTYRVGDVEDGNRGGFARVATVIRELQAEGREVHVLHGGDLLSPSLESQIWRGQQMVEALNFIDSLAPVYLVAGNHEFDTGNDEVAYFINAVRSSRFDWIGDSYRFVTGDAPADNALHRAFIFEAGGKTIGLFAVTLHPDDGGTARDYVEFDADYLAIAERVMAELESQDVDMIIGLTHLHMKDDRRIAALREAHPLLEFIAGGHDHEKISERQTPTAAAIFKGSSNARDIWRIDVDFDNNGAASIRATALPMDRSVPKDPAYQQLADRWRAELLRLYPIVDATVGQAKLRFDVTEESIRNDENAWGNFLADTARTAFGKPHSDFAFIHSGSIRIDDAIAGDISYEDIARTFGFPSQLRRVEISGADFEDLMEAGYRGSGTSQGYFPQVAGFRVCIDRRMPDYERIQSLQIETDKGWQDIDPAQTYSLILPDYLFGDRDGYRIPAGAKATASPPGPELKYLVLDQIIKAQFEAKGVGSAVDPANPRFVSLGPARAQCWPAAGTKKSGP